MRLLLDANFSWRFTAKLGAFFEMCLHANKVGLPVPATNTRVWNYAAQHDLIIFTNDDDFLNFSNIRGFPPKVVLLRTGNQPNEYLFALLIEHRDAIAALHASDDTGVLEIF